MAKAVEDCKISQIGQILNSPERPMKERFRALFTLRNIGGQSAIDWIAKTFTDPSDLLKHESAYVLGQMGDDAAICYLVDILKDTNQQPIVRHEAGEALGAIGNANSLDLLKKYSQDPCIEVAETCQLAVGRIEWLQKQKNNKENLLPGDFVSVDPAPPDTADKCDAKKLKETLLDEKLPLFERYRAMFSLRNKGDTESVLALAEGLQARSALFRHEIAYVLGQLADSTAAPALSISLRDTNEQSMVRHECAEALGAIGTPDCSAILQQYAEDSQIVVRESCQVALDMCEYEMSSDFQYANTLDEVTNS